MREQQFRDWLKNEYPANNETGDLEELTIDTQIGRVRRIEDAYDFNLDKEFKEGRLVKLLKDFHYSEEDKRNKRPNPTKMTKINPASGTLADYKTSLKKYSDFCEKHPPK